MFCSSRARDLTLTGLVNHVEMYRLLGTWVQYDNDDHATPLPMEVFMGWSSYTRGQSSLARAWKRPPKPR